MPWSIYEAQMDRVYATMREAMVRVPSHTAHLASINNPHGIVSLTLDHTAASAVLHLAQSSRVGTCDEWLVLYAHSAELRALRLSGRKTTDLGLGVSEAEAALFRHSSRLGAAGLATEGAMSGSQSLACCGHMLCCMEWLLICPQLLSQVSSPVPFYPVPCSLYPVPCTVYLCPMSQLIFGTLESVNLISITWLAQTTW